jgi:predicted metal-dependent peptidase
MKNIHDEISRCIIQMLLKEPFYAHLLSGVVRNITSSIPTAAVGIRDNNINLFVNEEFFLKELRTSSNRIAVIKHETLHLVFKHLFRSDLKKYNHLLFNYAADIVVNQFIGSWRLPESAITLNTFPDLNLEPDQTVEWYYKKLADLLKEMKKINKGGLLDPGSKNKSKEEAEESGTSKQGGSDSSQDWSKTSAPESAKVLEKIYGTSNHSDHSIWGAPDELQANKDACETEFDRMIIQARDRTPVKDRGTIPGEINQMIDAMLEKRKPKVDWKRALRLFSSNSRRTRIYHSMKRISKRYGTRPGIRIKRFQKMAIAVDTSGSVNDQELGLFFSEIHGMWRQGAEIEIFETDAAVQRHYPYKGKLPEFVSGRGGTSFDPIFDFLRKNRQLQYDGCIYLTDGYAPEPQIRPPCKLMWVITPDGDAGDHLKFGRVIKL